MKKREFRQVSGASIYRAWKHWEEGDVFVGKFVRETTDQFKNPSWVFKIEEVEFNDPAAEKIFQPGKLASLNSTGMLNKTMEEQVVPGNIVKIVYRGMDTISKGPFAGKEAHVLEISVAEDEEFSGEEEENSDNIEL